MKKNMRKKALKKSSKQPLTSQSPKHNATQQMKKTLADTSRQMNRLPLGLNKQKVENILKMYGILQSQMAEYLLNLQEKEEQQKNENEPMTPDEKIKEFENMLNIFIKFESLCRKLEKTLSEELS